jgi:hypothetical protein
MRFFIKSLYLKQEIYIIFGFFILIFRGLPLLFNAIFGGSPRISFAFSLTD